jgi:hypothetical protein
MSMAIPVKIETVVAVDTLATPAARYDREMVVT